MSTWVLDKEKVRPGGGGGCLYIPLQHLGSRGGWLADFCECKASLSYKASSRTITQRKNPVLKNQRGGAEKERKGGREGKYENLHLQTKQQAGQKN